MPKKLIADIYGGYTDDMEEMVTEPAIDAAAQPQEMQPQQADLLSDQGMEGAV
jgi:hypothetical protein